MKFLTAQKSQRGFTLIELLVVIGILGILAAALVATIDPFEQLNKADDSNAKNTAVEFLNANIRYYTTHSSMPWHTVNNGPDCLGAGNEVPASYYLSNSTMLTDCIQNQLIKEGELKAAFTTATQILGRVILNENNNNITMCFLPKSKSQRKDPNTRFLIDGSDASAAEISDSVTNHLNDASFSIYWCAK